MFDMAAQLWSEQSTYDDAPVGSDRRAGSSHVNKSYVRMKMGILAGCS